MEKREENDHAWKVKSEDILKYDENKVLISANLDIKNPKSREEFEHLPPEQLIEDILQKENKIIEIMAEIKELLKKGI